jgi:hypothetical protein
VIEYIAEGFYISDKGGMMRKTMLFQFSRIFKNSNFTTELDNNQVINQVRNSSTKGSQIEKPKHSAWALLFLMNLQ